jgi:hypothetical protein
MKPTDIIPKLRKCVGTVRPALQEECAIPGCLHTPNGMFLWPLFVAIHGSSFIFGISGGPVPV